MRRYLIWDFDGTLGFRIGGFTSALINVIRDQFTNRNANEEEIRHYLQTGFPWHTPDKPHTEILTADEWWNNLHPVFERAYQGLGYSDTQSRNLAQKVRREYIASRDWRLFGDTIISLERMKSNGWTQFILSNHVPEIPEILHYLNIDLYIKKIFNSAQTGYEKPHPQAFRNVIKEFEEKSTIWMIGDNYQTDIQGAESVGIPSILVRKENPNAKYYCKDLIEVTEYLGKN